MSAIFAILGSVSSVFARYSAFKRHFVEIVNTAPIPPCFIDDVYPAEVALKDL
jgi:hypothetical protein